MAKKRRRVSQMENNGWLYEINFKRDEMSLEMLNHNHKEIEDLVTRCYQDKDCIDKIKNFTELIDELESLLADLDVQLDTVQEAEDNGEAYIQEQYEMSLSDVETELEYVFDQIFDVFDAKLETTDGRPMKFCWAGMN